MKAIITGISGQDGYFLSKLLYSKGYEIHGILRRNSSMTQGTVSRLPFDVRDHLIIHYGDITDSQFISTLVSKEKPDEFYHLAAQSFVGYSFQNAMSTYDANISGTLNVCNAIKDFSPDTRMYFAATSEMFGQPKETPQTEHTVLAPRSPYAVSKLAGYWTVKTYRDAYNLFMANGILFNHESEVRGPEFVTRKITQAVARISAGSKDPLILGNLEAVKDWGYAEDYIDAMYRILKQDFPDDFVIGTGESHTVREFVEVAFKQIGVNITWRGKGINEIGLNDEGKTVVRVSKEFFRPLESDNYRADYSRAKTKLGWNPKIKFKDLVEIMVKEDLKLLDSHGK